MCMRPCGPVRHHRVSRRTAQKKETTSVIYPTATNVILSKDGQVRVGKHVIGEWYKEEAYEGGFHFRPVYSSTKMCYVAHIYHKDLVKTSRKMDLYHDIACLCKAGITITED